MVRLARPIQQQTTAPKSQQTTQKLLYIDDEPEALFLFTELFRTDYQVLTAHSGEEGIEILKQNPDIPVIVTDQRMPEMTGIEFFDRILPDFPYPTRIVLTGYTEVEDIVAAINTGRVYQYVTKPWADAHLQVVIGKAIEHYQLTMENHQLLAEQTSLLENMGDGLIAIDTEGQITMVNPQAMQLLRVEDELAFPANVSQVLIDFPGLTAVIERTLQQGAPQPHQELSLDGKRSLLVSSSLIHLPEHRTPSGIIVLLSDVTELQQLQRRVAQQEHQNQRQALLNELGARFRHRIGNDLGGIQLSAKRLQGDLPGEKRQQSIALILSAVDEMTQEVKRFRNGIRTLNELQQLQLHPGDINPVIETALSHAQAETEVDEISVDTDLAPSLPQIPLDPKWLKDAIQNLIINAFDVMAQGGRLTVCSRLVDGEIEVLIADTGRGIPEEYQSRIFTPYFTLKPQGTGLGLPMARDVVLGHGGDISVESEVDKGTTFRLRFPCQP